MIYRATVPPDGATCDTQTCDTVAKVRVTLPPSQLDPAGDTWDACWDCCDLHWPAFRSAAVRNGHQVTDATGELRELHRDHPSWRIFRSDRGRLYAARPGLTVYGWLTAQLRAEMQAASAPALGEPS
jgi:hypothetical protein